MPLTKLIRTRLTDALAGTPAVIETLLHGISADSPVWDYTPSPDRFTLREVLAHLADYDDIWNEYMTMARASDGPADVPMYTPDEVAAKGDYPNSVPAENLARLRKSRAALVALLPTPDSEDWEKYSIRSPRHGHLNVDELASLFLAHDGYHTRQIAEYVTGNR